MIISFEGSWNETGYTDGSIIMKHYLNKIMHFCCISFQAPGKSRIPDDVL